MGRLGGYGVGISQGECREEGEEEGDRDRGELRDSGSREKQREGEKGGEMRKNEGREKKE